MTTTSADVALIAAPYGFGPLGKALAVADELHERGLRVQILCGSSGRLLFTDRPYRASEYKWRDPLDLDALDVPLVLSCGDTSTPLRRSRTRLIVLDSLLWLRGRWERLPEADADLYLAQRFFLDPPEDALVRLNGRLRFVDAVLPRWARSRGVRAATAERSLFIYPGGLYSPVLEEAAVGAYLKWIARVLDAVVTTAGLSRDQVFIRVPEQCLSDEGASLLRQVSTLLGPAPTAMRHLDGASHVLIAPGIETALEVVALGFEPHFLPPLNGTHLAQLIGFRAAGIGDELTRSYSACLHDLEAETTELNVLSQKMAERAMSLLPMEEFIDEAARHLRRALLSDGATAGDRYPLGGEGAVQVADAVLDLLSA